jgi:hypothetical protein
MKILNLTREVVSLEFSINELIILRDSLITTQKLLDSSDFQARIRGFSKDQCLELAMSFGEILNSFDRNCNSRIESPFVRSINFAEDRIILQLTYHAILGLNCILNSLVNGNSIKDEDFQDRVGFDRASLEALLDSIHSNALDRMEEDMPETIIFKKVLEIFKEFKLEYRDFLSESLYARIKKDCQLNCHSQNIIFRLASLNDRKVCSGIQIGISQQVHQETLFFRSKPQAIRHLFLVRLIAYLEQALASAIPAADLEIFKLALPNAKKNPLFEIRIHPIPSNSNEFAIQLSFERSFPNQSEDTQWVTIEDSTSTSQIYSFIASIREFLTELSTTVVDIEQ